MTRPATARARRGPAGRGGARSMPGATDAQSDAPTAMGFEPEGERQACPAWSDEVSEARAHVQPEGRAMGGMPRCRCEPYRSRTGPGQEARQEASEVLAWSALLRHGLAEVGAGREAQGPERACFFSCVQASPNLGSLCAPEIIWLCCKSSAQASM